MQQIEHSKHKYNNTYSTIKKKRANVNSSNYIDSDVEKNDAD